MDIKSIATTLAILGSGALALTGCEKDAPATETPGMEAPAAGEASCGAEKADGEASCGAEKADGEASCGAENAGEEGEEAEEAGEASCGG